MDQPPFTYQPRCSDASTEGYPTFKVAAPWSYGNIRELKTYALCRQDQLEEALSRARAEVAKLVLSDGEQVGPVGVYRLLPGLRDAERTPIE